MIKRLLLSLTLMCLVALLCDATKPAFKTASGKDGCNKWVSTHFKAGVEPPFSFKYDGVQSSKFLTTWKFAHKSLNADRPGETLESYSWTDPESGLQVECRVKRFSDFNALEWCLHMRNLSADTNTGTVSDVRTMDMVQKGVKGEWKVFSAEGPRFGRTDFMPRDTVLAEKDTMMLSPAGGRSSSHTMPFFNIKSQDGGMVYAVGWTGTWVAEMDHVDGTSVNVRTGVRRFESYLLPGEDIRFSSTVAIPWQGEDRMDGQNILRRFIMAHHHPYANGKPVEVPVCCTLEPTHIIPCDEFACMTDYHAMATIRRNELFKTVVDAFWMDAGWYSRAGDFEKKYWWHSAVGNWTPDPFRFPNGMAEISKMAHKAGSGLLLWYEPERANVDSDWAHEHPEYMIAESGEPAVPLDEVVDSAFLVNYAKPEALDFVIDYMTNSLLTNGVDIYRQDFNISPENFWINNDKPGRVGMTEVGYINGLYKYLDTLHERIPGLIIDNCAGGGRRLDIEMLSRGISLWRSDYSIEAEGNQCQVYNLHQWFPVHCTASNCVDKYRFHTNLGPGVNLTFSGVVTVPQRQEIIKKVRKYKTYYLDDFYPLSGYGPNTGDDIWLAYQVNVPQRGEGLVVAFRRADCKESDYEVKLRGLEPDAAYLLHYDDPQISDCTKTGAELSEGLTLHLEKALSSLLIEYTRQ